MLRIVLVQYKLTIRLSDLFIRRKATEKNSKSKATNWVIRTLLNGSTTRFGTNSECLMMPYLPLTSFPTTRKMILTFWFFNTMALIFARILPMESKFRYAQISRERILRCREKQDCLNRLLMIIFLLVPEARIAAR